MRLIRAVLQPVSIRWYSVCASSGTSLITKKARVRVPKDVRKSMVENFVNRYRKANAGKFPTVSAAKKDVGGSYYVIREILQELIYNSKMSLPVDTKTASSEKSAIKKDEILTTNTEKDSQATEMEKELIIIGPISEVAVQDSSSEIFESNQHPQPSISVASDDESKEVGKQCYHTKDEPRSKPHLDPENDKTAHEDGQKLDGSESTEVSGRELQKVSTKDADKTKSSLWQNLKSLANEILEMWKKK